MPPPHSGSDYYNYKGSFSIVLLALVDHDYCFLYADIGAKGRISDGGVFNNSILWEKICANSINLPQPSLLPNSNVSVPYVFLGDGAFALSSHIMKPFPGHHAVGTPQRLFNQQLSRTRVIVENAFGILSNKFRIFKKPMQLNEVKASVITKTCVLLHNFLRKSRTSRNIYTPPGSLDLYKDGELISQGSWRNNKENCFSCLQPVARRASNDAIQIRQKFMHYFEQQHSLNL